MRRSAALYSIILSVVVSIAASAAQFHFGSLTLTVPDGFEVLVDPWLNLIGEAVR